MTAHCPACATADELARHRDAACPEWSVRRATLNFAVVIARRNCPAYSVPDSHEWLGMDR